MTCDPCGPAIVLVYANGNLEAALVHPHDGGEPYMGPLLRKGIQYAKTHYDCGNIVDILLAESDMRRVDVRDVSSLAERDSVRHVYYITYKWDPDTLKKVYHLFATHLDEPAFAGNTELPDEQRRIPRNATRMV